MSDDDDAGFFFISNRKEDEDKNKNKSKSHHSQSPEETKDNNNEDAAEKGPASTTINNNNTKRNKENNNNNRISSLLSPLDVIEMSSRLCSLVSKVPETLQSMNDAVSGNNNKEKTSGGGVATVIITKSHSSALPKVSQIDLRRQQMKLEDWVSNLVNPLNKLVVRWEEEVVRNFEDLISWMTQQQQQKNSEDSSTTTSSTIEDLRKSYSEGNDSLEQFRQNKYSKMLNEIVDERKRELRLSEDLLNIGVW